MFLLRAALERLCGLLGLRGHFADVKDPEGCSTPRRPSFRLLGSGDLPGALIELPTSKIREGLQHIQEGEVSAPGLWRPAWCSDQAADVEDQEGLQRIQGRRGARSRASEILLAL